MCASPFIHNFCTISSSSPNFHHVRTCALTHSHFLSSNSSFNLKIRPSLSNIPAKISITHKPRSSSVVLAAQSNFFKVLQTAWKVGRDGIEAGTNLVPSSIPRPVARISVTIVALSVSLFVLKSFLSMAFFVLATMGLAYFAFIAINKDQGSTSSGDTTSSSMEDPVEEARKIMDKYK
ncbi:TATA-binding protein-associated factor [Senna tora]|uniref:TATA-binding protein-associated factor n=1 Tax=Senna tora TaxID=362788 RepID=A0A834XHC2_9FABA|nr:TATA-binding protein-associated factor [Senna tora]